MIRWRGTDTARNDVEDVLPGFPKILMQQLVGGLAARGREPTVTAQVPAGGSNASPSGLATTTT